MRGCRRIASGHPRISRCVLLIGCAGIALFSHHAEAAGTLPSGGHFVAGTGGVATAGNTTTVTQSSQRAIVDWNSFSIGKGSKVQFDNGSGATLNRVTGGSLSTIAGQLKATGSVYLINPNGVVVGAGGKVVTGGSFVASTRDASDSQFMAGGAQTFSGRSNGAVVNDGAVVSQNGNVVLIGHAVTNGGRVDAAKGKATLASGNTVILTDANGPSGVYVAKGKSGDTTNAGQVRAAAVELASAGGNVYALAGNRHGLVSATGTKTIDGQVWLTAPQGTVDVAGTVAAMNADGSGGAIMAKGAAMKLENAAVVNAAGRTGHGKVETSGDAVSIGKAKVTAGKKGSWTIDPTDLTIDAAAAVTVDAALNLGTDVMEQTTSTVAIGAGTQTPGNGDIVVAAPLTWTSSAKLTLDSYNDIQINASITGNSGALVLNAGTGVAAGSIAVNSPLSSNSMSATAGTAGTIGLSFNGGVPTVRTTGGGQTYNSPVLVVTDLGTVTETGNGAITFLSTVDASPAGGVALVVDAGSSGTVTFSRAIGGIGALDGFSSTGNTTLDGNLTTNNSIVFNGSLTLGAPVTLSASALIDFEATVDGNFALTAGAGTALTFAQTVGGTTPLSSLNAGGNTVTVGAPITTAGGLTLSSGQAGSTLAIDGALTATGSTVTLNSGGPITQTAIIKAGTLSGSSVGGTTLNGGNQITTLGAFADTGAGNATGFNLTNAQALAVGTGAGETVSSTGPINLTTTGGVGSPLTLDGNLSAAGKTVTLTSSGAIAQTGGTVTAGTLTGLAFGDATLDKDNQVGTFSLKNDSSVSGSISFTDTVALTIPDEFSVNNLTITTKSGAGIMVTGHVHADVGVTLNSAGTIVETGSGFVETGTSLSGSSVGGADLSKNNLNASFENFTNTGGGAVTYKNTALDAFVGGIATSGALTMKLAGVTIDGSVTAGAANTLRLNSSRTVGQSAGTVSAGTLTGSSVGGMTIGSATLTNFGPWTDTGAGSGGISLTNSQALTTTGAISTAGTAGAVSLTTSGGGLTVGGAVTGDSVALNAAGAVAETGGGTVTATTLTGSSAGGASLGQSNNVAKLGAFTNTGSGNFSFTDAAALQTTGTIMNSVGNVTLKTTGGGHDMALASQITGVRVTLDSAGTITQSSGGIDPGSLLIDAAGAVSLTGANTVDTIAARITGAGAGLTFNDTANGLTVGTVGGVVGVATNNGDIVLRTTASGTIAVNAAVDAGTGIAKIAASDNLKIGAAGSVSAGGGATLAALGDFSNAAGANAITVGAGKHWLVYSTDPNADSDGGLAPDFIQYAATYTIGTLTGTAPATTGNGFLYSLAPTVAITGVTKTYDGTTGLTGVTYTLGNGVSGDVIVAGGSPTGGFADKNAGTGVGVTVKGLTVSATRGGVAVFGYAIAPSTSGPIGTILKANLSVGLTGTVTKTYDGTTAAALGTGNFSLSGLLSGDDVTVSAGSAAYGTANAGTGISVTASGYALSGADAGNYVLTTTGGSALIGKIDPRTVTVGLAGTVDKLFDGTTVAMLTGGNYVLTGVLSGDSVSLNDPTIGTYAKPQPGKGIAVTVDGLALSGADAGNYRLAGTSVTANIGEIDSTPPSAPYIPVPPPQPPVSSSSTPQAVAANAIVVSRAAVVPKPEMAEMAKLSGCSGEDFVAVVPGEDGHVGAVVVESEGSKTVLHAAYAGCSGSKPVITSPAEVNRLFGGALAARPTPPASFQLYYRAGSVKLEPDALAAFDKAFAEIGQRKAVDVVVTGFTDTVGSPQANDLLSLARAQAVAKLLQARGLKGGSVMTFGRGERDLQVKTAPQVAEEKNRRVEITVR